MAGSFGAGSFGAGSFGAGSFAAGATPLALSSGDPAGIGLDITLAAWAQRERHRLPAFALYADPSAVQARARALGLDIPIRVIADVGAASAVFGTALPVVSVPLAVSVEPGRPDSRNGRAVIAAIEQATAAVAIGAASALVTNPIAKSVLYEAGFAYPGHTEFLADLAARHFPRHGSEPAYTSIMMLAAAELRVVPLTIHVALETVAASITQSSIATALRIMHRALIEDFGIPNPRIAVAGLNPHAGESATMGLQDRDVIAPGHRGPARAGSDIDRATSGRHPVSRRSTHTV